MVTHGKTFHYASTALDNVDLSTEYSRMATRFAEGIMCCVVIIGSLLQILILEARFEFANSSS